MCESCKAKANGVVVEEFEENLVVKRDLANRVMSIMFDAGVEFGLSCQNESSREKVKASLINYINKDFKE